MRTALSEVPAGEREAILHELSDHVSDAVAVGRPLEEVLQALGPADVLGRAYAVELALNAPASRLGVIDRALTVVGLLAVASLPSFVVCVVLSAIGAALVAAGVGVVAGGVAALVRPALVPDLTVSPWVLFLIGPLLAALGAASLVALFVYVRFLVRLTRQTLKRTLR